MKVGLKGSDRIQFVGQQPSWVEDHCTGGKRSQRMAHLGLDDLDILSDLISTVLEEGNTLVVDV
jgi:hypothetical protein